ncbi:MAG: hypothetical protein ABSG93_11320 [Solirubrobacteraceae bacterium]|jgi:hypothetical protein
MAEAAEQARHEQEPWSPAGARPCVVQYLYIHEAGEQLSYPSSRSSGGAARLAARYLECVLVQAASLRWRVPDCELLLVSNLASPDSLTRRGRALLARILALGVELVPADYRHAPREPVSKFYSSRYVLDAIDAVAARVEPDRQLWLVDVDCVWLDPQAAFAAAAATGAIGTVQIGYPPDWKACGYTREELGGLGQRLGDCPPAPAWIGGEVLAGTAAELRELARACERLDEQLADLGVSLDTEEQLMTLAGGLGRVQFTDLSAVAGRIWTGRRHGASNPPDPQALALWHVPSEKGLSIRRAANALLRGRAERVRRDLSSSARAAVRFNVAGVRRSRSLRDDSWIVLSRVRDAVALRLAGRAAR